MKRLTKKQEYDILNRISGYNDYIDRGSSRMVFAFGKNLVIKIAVDNSGRVQNTQERDVYFEHSDICARVYAYGSSILISERLDTTKLDIEMIEEYYDCYEDVEEIYEEWDQRDRHPKDARLIIEAFQVAKKIANMTGVTPDNAQIGVDKSGKCKSYDSGFFWTEDQLEGNSPRQCGTASELFEENTTDEILDLVKKFILKH